jgi:hypothetical protein
MSLCLLFYFMILLHDRFTIEQKLYKTVLFFLLLSLCLKMNDYAFHLRFSLISKVSCNFETSFISSFNIH